MPRQQHVIVLGLGVAGSSIAATLAQRGFRVTGVEQFAPLHERGSSHGDTRIFRRVPHEGEAYVQMASASVAGWRKWNRMVNEPLFVACGGIDAGPHDSGLVDAAEWLCKQYEQPCSVMDGAAFNRQYGHFNLPFDWKVVYQPESGFVRPDATRIFLHAQARENGARLLYETAVLGIDWLSDRVRLHTRNETLAGDVLVVAAGSWLPKLVPDLSLSLSTERRVTAWFRPQVEEDLTDGRVPIFCLDADGGWYGMPTPDGTIKVGHDKHFRQKIDPDGQQIVPDAEDADHLSLCVQKYFTGIAAQPCAMKPCIYSLTEDRHFLIDWHPRCRNLLIFSCCSGHGFKYAPIYGEIAADLIHGKARPELELFRFQRDGLAATRFSELEATS
jgi:sarcosine oxidase